MSVKIDIQTSAKLPKKTLQKLHATLDSLPREHVIGIDRIKIVGVIDDPRLNPAQRATLPGLYHPRQGNQRAWLEISAKALLGSETGFLKKLLPRIAFYNNLAAVTVSLIGQHYYISFRHSVKKGSLESAVKSYTAKHLKHINESQNSFRAKVFRPLQPTLERWAQALRNKSRDKRALKR